jgi:hypothetical protein
VAGQSVDDHRLISLNAQQRMLATIANCTNLPGRAKMSKARECQQNPRIAGQSPAIKKGENDTNKDAQIHDR